MKITLPIIRLLWIATLLLGVFNPPVLALAQDTPVCQRPYQPVSVPLIDLGNDAYVRMDGTVTEFTGGLYPQGSNTRPPELESAALELAGQITPLDENGNPDPAGKIVMLSIGMSNTEMEFSRFMHMAQDDAQINPSLVLFNGAISGQTADRWVDPQSGTWQEFDFRLQRARLSPQQVQVAWVKQTLLGKGEFPAKTLELQSALEAIARDLKGRFPNLKIAYYSSRTRAYAYPRGLSPEPLAFEGGFAVKWMIEKQMGGDPTLNYDPGRGPVQAPLLVWGPYLWIDGTTPRSDGRTWLAEDLAQDCVHPSESGRTKVAEMLMEFFKADTSTVSWFLAGESAPAAPGPVSAPTSTPTAAATAPVTPTSEPISASPTAEVQGAPDATAPALEQAPAPTASPMPAAPAPESPSSGLLVLLGLGLIGGGFAAGWLLSSRRRPVP